MHLLVACESSLNAPGSFSGDRSLCLVAGLVRCRSDIPGSSNLVVGRSICHACGACSSAWGWLRFRFCGIAHTPSLHLPSFSILLLARVRSSTRTQEPSVEPITSLLPRPPATFRDVSSIHSPRIWKRAYFLTATPTTSVPCTSLQSSRRYLPFPHLGFLLMSPNMSLAPCITF